MKLTEKDMEQARRVYQTLITRKPVKSGASAKRKSPTGTEVSLLSRVALVTGQAAEIELPPQAVEALTEILEQLAAGKEVTVAAKSVEMTTQQAAEFLRVSRPFLINLLEKGEIPFRKVGAHRRVLYADLEAYKNAIDARRLKVLGELAAQAQELDMGY